MSMTHSTAISPIPGTIIGNFSGTVYGYDEAYSDAYGVHIDDDFSGQLHQQRQIAGVNSGVVSGS